MEVECDKYYRSRRGSEAFVKHAKGLKGRGNEWFDLWLESHERIGSIISFQPLKSFVCTTGMGLSQAV